MFRQISLYALCWSIFILRFKNSNAPIAFKNLFLFLINLPTKKRLIEDKLSLVLFFWEIKIKKKKNHFSSPNLQIHPQNPNSTKFSISLTNLYSTPILLKWTKNECIIIFYLLSPYLNRRKKPNTNKTLQKSNEIP